MNQNASNAKAKSWVSQFQPLANMKRKIGYCGESEEDDEAMPDIIRMRVDDAA